METDLESLFNVGKENEKTKFDTSFLENVETKVSDLEQNMQESSNKKAFNQEITL